MPVWMLEKERSGDAWQRIQDIVKDPESGSDRDKQKKLQKRYRSQVRGGPAMIQKNGLGQYLAFLASKGFEDRIKIAKKADDRANALLFQHLGRWLAHSLKIKTTLASKDVFPTTDRNPQQFSPLEWLMEPQRTIEDTMRATREVMAWLQWARRFAESQLSEPDNGDD
jgi:CRISPR type III-B/RAMP module-associated protein Cmr5